MVYRNCMEHCIGSPSPLPQWYLLTAGEQVLGGAGPIVNDFISRGDLWPWLCALYVEEPFRGQGLGGRLISHICGQALALGYHSIHLCTEMCIRDRYNILFEICKGQVWPDGQPAPSCGHKRGSHGTIS